MDARWMQVLIKCGTWQSFGFLTLALFGRCVSEQRKLQAGSAMDQASLAPRKSLHCFVMDMDGYCFCHHGVYTRAYLLAIKPIVKTCGYDKFRTQVLYI